jgi:hypothetical protein
LVPKPFIDIYAIDLSQRQLLAIRILVTLAAQREGGIDWAADAEIGFDRERQDIETVPNVPQEDPAIAFHILNEALSDKDARNICKIETQHVAAQQCVSVLVAKCLGQ